MAVSVLLMECVYIYVGVWWIHEWMSEVGREKMEKESPC